MKLQIKSNLIRVVILNISGIYSQIYDEIYCNEMDYNNLLLEFGDSNIYKIIVLWYIYINFIYR